MRKLLILDGIYILSCLKWDIKKSRIILQLYTCQYNIYNKLKHSDNDFFPGKIHNENDLLCLYYLVYDKDILLELMLDEK